MSNHNHLNHCTWDCKYHIVFTPKYRKKSLYGSLRKDLKDTLHRLALQKECKIEEGYLMPDHVHMMVSIPPKHSISHIVGFLKGKKFDLGGSKHRGQAEEFCGSQILGTWIFREHGRCKRRSHPQIRSEPRVGRQTVGRIEPV